MNPHTYCQDKTAASGSSFYYSFRFLPAEKRRAITALYAFCREVDDVVDESEDAQQAAAQLDEWRDEIAAVFDGRPQHPVGIALKEVAPRFGLPREQLLEIIDGMAMDLEQNRYKDFGELRLYCYRVASVVGLLSAEIFGYQDRQTLKYAHELGLAFQMTNIIRDVGEDAQRNRIYLPQEELGHFNVSEDDILAGRDSENFRKLMAFQARRAREFYNRAYMLLPECDRKRQQAGLMMAAIYRTLLGEITRADFPVLTQRMKLSRTHKLWIALVTWYRVARS